MELGFFFSLLFFCFKKRSFLSSKSSYFQDEAKCELFLWKWVSFSCCTRIKNHIFINGFALSLVLKKKLWQLDEDRLCHIRSHLSLRRNRFRAKRLRQHSVTIKILRMRVFYGVSCFIKFHCWHLQGYYDTYIMKCIEKCEKKPLLIGM